MAETQGNPAESGLDNAVVQIRAQKEDVLPHTIESAEKQPESTVKLTIGLDRAAWDKRVEGLFKEIQQTAVIEGFRKGKAPVALLKRRYMREACSDVAEKALPAILRKYEQDQNTMVYGTPVLEDLKTEGSGPVQAICVIEVKPEIALGTYVGLEVEVPGAKLAPDAVDNEIERLRQMSGTFEEVDRPFASGDALALDLKAINAQGHTVDQRTNHLFERPADVLPAPLVEALVGKKAGDDVALTVPAGEGGLKEPLTFQATVKSVKEARVPEANDDFAKDLGHESLAAMRASLTQQAEDRVREINEEAALEALLTKLVEQHQFDVPPALVAQTERDMAYRDYRQFAATGQAPARLQDGGADDYNARLAEDAKRRVKAYLLADAIGAKEGVESSEADVETALSRRAAAEGRKPAAIRAALERRKEWNQFLVEVRFSKIRDLLLARNNIKYVDPPATPPAEG